MTFRCVYDVISMIFLSITISKDITQHGFGGQVPDSITEGKWLSQRKDKTFQEIKKESCDSLFYLAGRVYRKDVDTVAR